MSVEEESVTMSFRISLVARDRIRYYCDLNGMKASEVIKASIAQFISPCLVNYDRNTRVIQNDVPTRARHNNLDLSKDKSSRNTEQKQEIQKWFKKFWVYCENKKMPDRVNKTIKEKWNVLKDMCPQETALKYNDYCNKEAMCDRKYCEPNSWLAGGGYDSEEEVKKEEGMDYDIS